MIYNVTAKNIDWDVEEQDIIEGMEGEPTDKQIRDEILRVKKSLPKTLTVEVEADNRNEAIDAAVDQMSEDIGWLINGAERYKVAKKKGKK